MTDDDATLLQRYARDRSERAFAELVRRHVNLVYAAALRQVNGDVHLAQDVTQSVFTDLARKSARLAGHRVLAGWLFTSARFAAAKLVRGEQRRRHREQEAHLMPAISPNDPSARLDWDRVRPILDEAMGELAEADRDALVLRYLEGCDYAQVGARLELSDNAARMRVDRAVDKLRLRLERRGITSTAGALGVALAHQAVVAAPAGLATAVTGAALAAGGGGALATLALMHLTKLQIGLAGAVIALGTGAYVAQERTNAALRIEAAGLPASPGELAALRQANLKLERTARQAVSLPVSDAELKRLGDEAAAVQAQVETAARSEAAARAAAGRREVYSIDQLDQKPKATRTVAPVFPSAMARAGIEGKVLVSFVVDAAGQVQELRVEESTRPEFEAPTLAAMGRWQFEPGRKDDRMVGTRVRQVVQFALEGSAADQAKAKWF